MRRERSGLLGALLFIGILASVVWVAAEEPRRGGSVMWFTVADLGHLDPHLAVSPVEQQALVGIYGIFA